MPKYRVVINETTTTTYEMEADNEEEVYDFTFEGEEVVNVDCLNWEIADVTEVTTA